RLPRPEHLWFTLCALVLMISGSLLTSILTGGIASLGGNFTLYSTFTAHYGGSVWEILSVLLAYALLPAFCEELVFRALLCAEYEERGVAVSVTVSALFFAMLHFSFPHFLTYLLLGALLALAMYTTRSFFTALLLHLLYNIFCLFGQPYLSAFYVNAGSNQIFIFCLVVLFLLFAAFAAGEARKIYHVYAKNNADSSYTRALPLKQYPRALLTAIFTPTTALCVLLWLVFSVLALF
ncbi:MAG: CPBP family intramembrane metalloprotease, partial [Clostridia bacterium]|nr:CPBP family intramembrane metalloprotease [Clostridia bacterium]